MCLENRFERRKGKQQKGKRAPCRKLGLLPWPREGFFLRRSGINTLAIFKTNALSNKNKLFLNKWCKFLLVKLLTPPQSNASLQTNKHHT